MILFVSLQKGDAKENFYVLCCPTGPNIHCSLITISLGVLGTFGLALFSSVFLAQQLTTLCASHNVVDLVPSTFIALQKSSIPAANLIDQLLANLCLVSLTGGHVIWSQNFSGSSVTYVALVFVGKITAMAENIQPCILDMDLLGRICLARSGLSVPVMIRSSSSS